MNLESFNRVTQVQVRGLDVIDFMRVRVFLGASVGIVRVFDGSQPRCIKFEWNHFDMAEHLNKSSVSVVLAEQLAMIPEASTLYLGLIEHIIDDWKAVDRTIPDIEADRCAEVIETLATKRDEIRENLREQPYLNATVDESKGRFSIPITKWESEEKAPQKPSE
ncbi:hypothetical protein [Vibrio lentus]|uniref:Uncharacterized protein n=1 Tax=Vibrio lentus TaxID=136468 RepID=A0A855ISD0_9VIBR|nr:hypothetical protein [Vibrio lentus]PMM60658.1 hypothetical protein BCT50_22140 [Vibrio lentus]